ncbi:hypothetical protein DL96DRAFT_1090966 [Flagelloscypha sp. PMI_526]|nr:hypothetical protein DL96DRAFT_1090966 [Flagelloscypha sp. PMI_526]
MPSRGKRKKLWNSIQDVSVTVLELVRDSADALPPLKSAAGFLTTSHKVAERIASLSRTTEQIQFRLGVIDDRIGTFFPETVKLSEDSKKILNACTLRLVEVDQELESLRTPKKVVAQFIHLRRTEKILSSLSSKLDQAELDLRDLYALHAQHRSSTMENDIGSINRTVVELHKKEEKLHAIVSSTQKIIVFFQSGPARDLF